jgi:hypothetical protein
VKPFRFISQQPGDVFRKTGETATLSRVPQQREIIGGCDVARNPHLPAAAPAGLLSRKVTGEVSEAAAAVQRKRTWEQNGVLAILRFLFHWVQGSALPKEA